MSSVHCTLRGGATAVRSSRAAGRWLGRAGCGEGDLWCSKDRKELRGHVGGYTAGSRAAVQGAKGESPPGRGAGCQPRRLQVRVQSEHL